jgi:RNA polymerase sigma factor (sigma-70 family)
MLRSLANAVSSDHIDGSGARIGEVLCGALRCSVCLGCGSVAGRLDLRDELKLLGVLVRLSCVGEDAALVEFCREEWPRLVGSLSLYLGRRDLAEDIAQETLVRVCGRWRQVREAVSPSAWAHRVAFNLAKSHGRRDAVWLRVRSRALPRDLELEEHDDAEAASVRAAVAALPSAQRRVVILRYFADLSIRDVAAVMGCPENTVKTHARRALEALRHCGLLVDEPATSYVEAEEVR